MVRKEKQTKPTIADNVDKYELYEESVQCAEAEIDFIEEQFFKLRGRHARSLREDFCGTASVCKEWINRDNKNYAVGVDIDQNVLDWGNKKHFSNLSQRKKSRIKLVRSNVLEINNGEHDVICATNFSYWYFSERNILADYFKNVKRSLKNDGMLVLDFYGGHDATKKLSEETKYDDFVYIWEQADFNPINNMQLCYIHFKFPDGSKLERAFTYSWRLWSIKELRELLLESGFSQSYVYWQEWDDDKNEAKSDFQIVEKVDSDTSWIGYIVALF